MARGSLNFFEMHIEKIVLGLCGLVLVASFVWFIVMSPNTVEYNNQTVGPRELEDAILNNARQLEAAYRNAKPEQAKPLNYLDQLKREFASGVLGATSEERPPIPQELTLAARYGLPIPTFEEEEETPNITLVTPLRPETPSAITGRSIVVKRRLTLADSEDREVAGDPTEQPWVSVAAWFPLKAQQDEMTRAGYAAYRTRVYFVGVDAQRREFLDGGEYSEWEDVTLSTAMPQFDAPEPAIDDETGVMLNKETVDSAFRLVKDSQIELVQPPFFEVRAGDFWDIPRLPGLTTLVVDAGLRPEASPSAAPAGAPQAEERPGAAATPPAERPQVDAREETRKIVTSIKEAQAAILNQDWTKARDMAKQVLDNPSARGGNRDTAQRIYDRATRRIALAERAKQPHSIVQHPELKDEKIAIWFHDDTVEAGKTYQYRLRAKIWNRYVGRMRALKNPEDARKTVLAGEWSLPSEPITVATSTHFFVASGSTTDDAVRMDVFKWLNGNWVKQSFDVRIGESVGGVKRVSSVGADVDFSTGAIVLDIRPDEKLQLRYLQGRKGEFGYRNVTTVVVTYLDPADGQVKEVHYDRDDPKYVTLRQDEI